ncbi:MAG TPA: hypothetical protein VF384_09630 [Planctomycetota bacterium]
MLHRPSLLSAATLLAAAMLCARAGAQCSTSWLPPPSLPGVDGYVNAMTNWDPDGAGPATPVTVVGGRFWVAGSVVTDHLATYDPATGAWGALGGIGPAMSLAEVYALAVMPNGDLVVGGMFSSVGGVTANSIARWNGSVWSPLGNGFNGRVRALAVMPNGDLVAGGDFIGSFAQVARWNGTTWSSLGPGLQMPWWEMGVHALAVLPNGDLVAGGEFWLDGSVPAGCLARWDGIRWSALGGLVDNYVHALVVGPNGDLFAGGEFYSAGGVPAEKVARWDGVTWSAVGQPYSVGTVRSLALLPNGNLVAGQSDWLPGIAQWNGTTWSALGAGILGAGPGRVEALALLPNGDLMAGGWFGGDGTLGALSIARWNGAVWSPLGSGFSGPLSASARLPNGDLVVGGRFASIGGLSAWGVARHDGVSWTPLGTGLKGWVEALAVRPNGDLVAGGHFDIPGGVSDALVARWDGTTWHPLATWLDPNHRASALAVLPNGDLVVGGRLGPQLGTVARWNGTAWSPLGGFGARVNALLVLPNGHVVAAGEDRYIKRFDGATWTMLGHLFDQPNTAVRALAAMPNGDLVAGGGLMSMGGVAMRGLARWNGAAWQPLGGLADATIYALEVLPGGDLAVGGVFTTAAGSTARCLGRWNGAGWAPMPDLSSGSQGATSPVTMLEMFGTELVVGGGFTAVGNVGGGYFARLATSCPASVIAFGSGCTGSGGPNVLAATSLPWIGSTFSAAATGMPANGVALAITGFGATAIPLSAILPQGGAGCFLLATPDSVGVALPAGGTVATALAIPAAAGLIGQVFHQQVVPLELGPLGAITALTSTNRLTALIGSF